MPRASWSGFLRLSLVTCPVYLTPATTEAKRIRLNQLNSKTGNRLSQRLVDSKTGEEVGRDQIVKGYEFDRDRYVTIDDDELKELQVEFVEDHRSRPLRQPRRGRSALSRRPLLRLSRGRTRGRNLPGDRRGDGAHQQGRARPHHDVGPRAPGPGRTARRRAVDVAAAQQRRGSPGGICPQTGRADRPGSGGPRRDHHRAQIRHVRAGRLSRPLSGCVARAGRQQAQGRGDRGAARRSKSHPRWSI